MKHVIILESPAVTQLLQNILKNSEYDLICVSNGDEVLHLCQHVKFDILITGNRIPGTMRGIELIPRVRKIQPEMKIVLLSGEPKLDHTADLFIRKPFSVQDFAQKIEALTLEQN